MTTDTAALVRQMRDALRWIADKRTGGMIQIRAQEGLAGADQWLAQQHGPLTTAQVSVAMAVAGYGASPLMTRAVFVDGLRAGERAHGICHPAGGGDKQC